MDQIREQIRDVPDFPKPGILFKDITPLLSNPETFSLTIDEMAKKVAHLKVSKVMAIESRGFLFGSALAYRLNAGLCIVRKPKKLPYKTVRVDYQLEYGTDSLEAHVDSLSPHDPVLIVDDVLATGGTARATIELAEKMGGKVQGLLFLAELGFLNGRSKLKGFEIFSILNL